MKVPLAPTGAPTGPSTAAAGTRRCCVDPPRLGECDPANGAVHPVLAGTFPRQKYIRPFGKTVHREERQVPFLKPRSFVGPPEGLLRSPAVRRKSRGYPRLPKG